MPGLGLRITVEEGVPGREPGASGPEPGARRRPLPLSRIHVVAKGVKLQIEAVAVSPTASHPFWARPFPDVASVHNGQITDYYLWRGRLERRGYRFLTENDSELIAVWTSDRMRDGARIEIERNAGPGRANS